MSIGIAPRFEVELPHVVLSVFDHIEIAVGGGGVGLG